MSARAKGSRLAYIASKRCMVRAFPPLAAPVLREGLCLLCGKRAVALGQYELHAESEFWRGLECKHVSPAQRKLVWGLVLRMHGVKDPWKVSAIIDHLWPNPDASPENEADTMRVQLNRVRDVILTPLGLRLVVAYGRGYTLEEEPRQ